MGEKKTGGRKSDDVTKALNFLREAQQHDGGESQKENYPLPPWMDKELIKEGQSFVRRNFFSVFFAHFISLIFLLCYGPVRTVLMKTSRSDSKIKALKRYLSTLIHVKRWYEGNLLELYENAAQDVYRVRRIHAGVSRQLKYKQGLKSQILDKDIPDEDAKIIQAIQKDMTNSYSNNNNNNNNNNDDYLIDEDERTNYVITQLDMAVTQFCFMGFILLFPSKFGIHKMENVDKENRRQLEGFVHIWAIIGHLLGVEDRFNLCLDRNAYTRDIVLHKVLLVDLMKCHAHSVKLWNSLATGISAIIPCISLRAVLLFVLRNLLECNSSENVNSLLTFYEKFCYKMMSWCFNCWIKSNFVRIILNSLLRLSIFLSERQHLPNRTSSPIIFHT